ncbi:MmgE/PrpD family protein [Mycobacterium sp. KBS0706]|uniref:MmgE/PrpD family protein n=1 Tax=Mycobacterium sp. KBS0706 TaxID=2578109 RepID=UPI00110F90DC|nr:MmgE/PrpD family protein [Mycobacterium sp. KBS0706]TSD84700.1 MmgE/PrpD family protein [Mycobacterium sp. KBS0706]
MSTATAVDHGPSSASVELPPPVTRLLAQHLVTARYEDLPADVRHEGLRTFLNWLGCAVGSARHEAVSIAIDALGPFSGPPQAGILGRSERMDVLHAALINGISSHVFDFDDTHLKTVIHPAGPVASAILALAELQPVSGRDFLNALVLGVDVECRIGNAVYPDHYHVGWHITGTAGVFGAAAAAGKLLGLDEQRMVWALGLAATQPVGLREMFGTMSKSFHPGRAAQNGLTAALLAQRGYTSSEQGIEAKRGWANVTSTHRNYDEITGELGTRNEILLNSYKPFACGIVIHPAIDGCVQLRNEHGLLSTDIGRIALRVHPLVLELTGKKTPKTGLDGKFSVYHSAAVAIIDGRAGEPQYSDERVRDPRVVALRDRVTAAIDPAMPADAVAVTVTLKDGRVLQKRVDHAIGSVARPMTDRDLDAKFADLVQPVHGDAGAAELLRACWDLESVADAGDIARMAQTA